MNSAPATSPTTPPLDEDLTPIDWRQLILLALVFALVLWHLLTFVCSWSLLPANDFGRMYASAALFVEGEDMYAWTRATPAIIEKNYDIDLYNMNPPHFHVLLVPLTHLHNPDIAFAVWWAISGWCLYYCIRWTLAETGVKLAPERRQTAVVLLLAFCGTPAMLYTGQLSFLLLVPVTLMWLAARRGCWGRVGVLLGLTLSIKPFLGVLLAYLLWRRRWRAVGICLAVVALCFGAGILLFGWHNHVSWHERLASSDGWAWLPMNASLMAMLTRTFTESVWYVPFVSLPARTVWLVWLGIGGVMGLVTLLATSRGESPEDVDQDFTLLLASAVLFCPLGWVYYLWLTLPPLVSLLARGWPFVAANEGRRWPRVALTIMVLAFIWPVISTRIGQPEYIGPRRSPELPPIGEGWPVPPSAFATLTIGNVYFWGLLTAWAALIASAIAMKRKTRARLAPQLAALDPADYRISVVMPVFSETDTVRQIAQWLMNELGSRLHEIIIIQSPRSSEQSRAVCRQLADEYPQVQVHLQRNNPGLGRAVREGFERATGNLVLMIDSDGEMEIETVPRMLDAMARGGYALVTASRWLPGGGFQGYSRLKYYLNWCFQQLFRWLFWTPLGDLTYGFKLIRAELVHGLAWQGTLHEIACETTLKIVRLGVPVAEVPSKWTARTQGVSKNTFWRNFRYVRTALDILLRGVPCNPRLIATRRETLVCHGCVSRGTDATADTAVAHAPGSRLNGHETAEFASTS